jgi:hypothetical protein
MAKKGTSQTITKTTDYNGYKTFYTSGMSASATQAKRFEVARIFTDVANWSGTAPVEIELNEIGYASGASRKYRVYFGYLNTDGVVNQVEVNDIAPSSGSVGVSNFQLTVGPAVVVNGTNKYLPIYVDVKYYATVKAVIKTSRTIAITNTGAGSGTIYVNTDPTGDNLVDFVPSNDVEYATAGSNSIFKGNIGIGTVTPRNKLEIFAENKSGLTLKGLGAKATEDWQGVNKPLAINASGEVVVGTSANNAPTITFEVKGDGDKYYPVVFKETEDVWANDISEFTLSHANVHRDAEWWGSAVAKFRFHSNRWGHGSSFVEPSVYQYKPNQWVPAKLLIAGWKETPYAYELIVWLRGKTTYSFKGNTLAPAVFDGIQNPLPYKEFNGGTANNYQYLDHNPKTTIDPYVEESAEPTWKRQGANIFTANPGNVGIGTTTPTEKLEVNGNVKIGTGINNSSVVLRNNQGDVFKNDFLISGQLGYTYLGNYQNYPLGFYTNNTERLRISENGNVGIGTTTPQALLDVNGRGVFKADPNNIGLQILNNSNNIAQMQFANINSGNHWYIGNENGKFNFYSGKVGGVGYAMSILDNGNVGIGTINPTEKLEVHGHMLLKQEANANLIIEGTGSSNYAGGALLLRAGDVQVNDKFNQSTIVTERGTTGTAMFSIQRRYNNVYNGQLLDYNDINGWNFYTSNGRADATTSSKFTINTTGNVGIGTTLIPSGYKLAVGGDVIAERVVVKLQTNWPDYVFKTGYSLRSLSEVEAFVKTNSHLPDVPSEAEIKEKGIDMEQMNATLLKKVEELTLYLIEQQKELDTLKEEIKQLKDKK